MFSARLATFSASVAITRMGFNTWAAPTPAEHLLRTYLAILPDLPNSHRSISPLSPSYRTR